VRTPWILAALVGLAGCGGGDDNPLTIPARIEAMEDCLPPTLAKAQLLFDVVELWRLQDDPAADPAGLSWQENAAGEVTVGYIPASCTLSMTISFYTSDGTKQDLDLSGATSLAEAIAAAADQLRDLDAGNGPFMVGVWNLDGPGNVGGDGAITAVIGGTANQNELERLRTTTGVVSGGEPPVASSNVTVDGGCELEFRFSDLMTDTVANQQYPIGTIDITVRNADATANGTITFNNTVNAVGDVNGIPGDFTINLDTGSVSYND
jgi:hypothetical protein